MNKRLTHAELAAAQERGDWPLLWGQATPLVKLVVGRMSRSGTMRREDADDDLLQEGMLIAGEAMRAWRPMECAFSTHITNRVRWNLLHALQEKYNGGIGSHKQKPIVLSLLDEQPHGEADMESGEENGDQGGKGSTFEDSLTYSGVVLPGGQYDGDGVAPKGYGDPSEEADVGAQEALRAALQHLTAEELELVSSVYGIGGGQTQTLAEYADARHMSLRTAERCMANAKALLAVHLRKFSN